VTPRHTRLVPVALLAFAALGCGEGGPTRYHVAGRATLGGEPIPEGVVIIEPDASRGNTGRQAYAPIRNGHFDTADGGEPVVPGAVIFRVEGRSPATAAYPAGVPLCSDYRLRAELPAKRSDFDVAVPASARLKPPVDPGPQP
jgi:hypothetical protein